MRINPAIRPNRSERFALTLTVVGAAIIVGLGIALASEDAANNPPLYKPLSQADLSYTPPTPVACPTDYYDATAISEISIGNLHVGSGLKITDGTSPVRISVRDCATSYESMRVVNLDTGQAFRLTDISATKPAPEIDKVFQAPHMVQPNSWDAITVYTGNRKCLNYIDKWFGPSGWKIKRNNGNNGMTRKTLDSYNCTLKSWAGFDIPMTAVSTS